MNKQNDTVSPLDEIVKNAMRFSIAKRFGPFTKCPDCSGFLKSCPLCQGREKISLAEVEAFRNPFTKIVRNSLSH